MRTAISDDLGKLDKEATSYDNAFRLSLQMFKLKEKVSDTQPLIKRRLEVAFGEVYNLQPVQMNRFRSYNAPSNKLFHSYAIFEN
ncbi:MAG: hypothetical protein WB474_13545 [Nitrososphaeraceae archaeon]